MFGEYYTIPLEVFKSHLEEKHNVKLKVIKQTKDFTEEDFENVPLLSSCEYMIAIVPEDLEEYEFRIVSKEESKVNKYFTTLLDKEGNEISDKIAFFALDIELEYGEIGHYLQGNLALSYKGEPIELEEYDMLVAKVLDLVN